MQRLSRRLHCELHTVALGDHDGEAALEVRADIRESTLLEEVGPRRVRRIDRVPLRRFDALFAGRSHGLHCARSTCRAPN